MVSKTQTLMIILVGLLSSLCYQNSLQCDFVFDDHLAIKTNPDVTDHNKSILHPDGPLFHDFWGRSLRDVSSHKSYRPLTVLTFRLNHFFCDFDARGYHGVNLVLHGFVSMLVVVLSFCLWDGGEEGEENFEIQGFFSGVLFGLHPVHVEAVTGLVGRAELLAAVFGILSFLFGMFAIQEKKNSWLVLMVVTFILAVLSKETVVMIPPLLLLYDLSFTLYPNLPELSTLKLKKKLKKLRPLFLRCFLYAIQVVSYGLLRIVLMSPTLDLTDTTLGNSKLIRRTENPYHFTEGISRILSLIFLQSYNIWLLFFPYPLCAEYSYNCIPMISGITDFRNIYSGFFYFIFFCFVIWILKNKKKKILIGLAWILVPYIPTSHVFLTVGTLIAERTLYLPSVGVCLLVGRFFGNSENWFPELFSEKNSKNSRNPEKRNISGKTIPEGKRRGGGGKIGGRTSRGQGQRSPPPTEISLRKEIPEEKNRRKKFRIFFWSFFALICSLAFYGTYMRTEDWKTDQTLFTSAVAVCPNSAKMHQQLGQVYQSQGDNTKAFHEFSVAQEIDPEFCELDLNLGTHYIIVNDYGHAVEHLKKNLGCLYSSNKALATIMKLYSQYFSINPHNSTAHREYAEIMYMINQPEESALHYREAGVIHLHAKQYNEAINDFGKAMLVHPIRCDIFYWEGKLYRELKNIPKAVNKFRQAMYCQGLEKEKSNIAGVHELHEIVKEGLVVDPRDLQEELFLRMNELGIRLS